jgi:hypothetical protein
MIARSHVEADGISIRIAEAGEGPVGARRLGARISSAHAEKGVGSAVSRSLRPRELTDDQLISATQPGRTSAPANAG